MEYVNENKAFNIMKKSDRKFVCEYEDGYLVSDGYFVFRTEDKSKLSKFGLVEINNNAVNDMQVLKSCMDDADRSYDTYLISPLCLAKGKHYANILYPINDKENRKGIKILNSKYLEVFIKRDVIFKTRGDKPEAPIYVYDESNLLGCVVGIRMDEIEVEQLSKIDFNAFK